MIYTRRKKKKKKTQKKNKKKKNRRKKKKKTPQDKCPNKYSIRRASQDKTFTERGRWKPFPLSQKFTMRNYKWVE